MIPEIQRSLPPRVFGYGLTAYSYYNKTRCLRKYGTPKPYDTVLDVGAYKGEFAIPASQSSFKVYAIEPDPTAYKYLRKACKLKDNIITYNHAIWNENIDKTMDIATKNADSALSVIGSDTKDTDKYVTPCMRLDTFPFIDEVTFLKIDGEGSEFEILQSLGEYRPVHIRADVSNERHGYIKASCKSLLDGMGYDCEINGDILKAIYR